MLLQGTDKVSQLAATEREIKACQNVIDEVIAELEAKHGEIEEIVKRGDAAIQQQRRLFDRIEREELWRGGDYESAEDYMDQKGFSRQRHQQIRDQMRIAQLVNSLDSMLPTPSDPMARELRKRLSDTEIMKVYGAACRENKGGPPALARLKVLIGAHESGADVDDPDAVELYQCTTTAERIISDYMRLPTSFKLQVREKINAIPDNS